MQIRRSTLDAWLGEIRVGWGERAARSASLISPVVALGQLGDLHMIGSQLASDGHQLDHVFAWFRALATRSRRVHRLLDDGGVINLASGWAAGALHDGNGAQVAPLDVLRLRIRQQMELIDGVGLPPGTNLALVVIDTNGSPECTARVARHARDVFIGGETMVSTSSGKLLVLVHRNHDIRRRTLRLSDVLRHDDQLSSTPLRVWIEPLAMAVEHIDSHLLDLVS